MIRAQFIDQHNVNVATTLCAESTTESAPAKALHLESLLGQIDAVHGAEGVGPIDIMESGAPRMADPTAAGNVAIPPPAPPTVPLTEDLCRGAESMLGHINQVVDDLLIASPSPGETSELTAGAQYRNLREVSAERLLALFLQLNIDDPNNSVQTHKTLHEVSSDLRQQGLEQAERLNELAAEKLREAAGYAEAAGIFRDVVTVITTAVSVIIGVITLGSAAVAARAAATAVDASMLSMIQAAIAGAAGAMENLGAGAIVAAGIVAALQVTNVVVQHEAEMVSLEAQACENSAKKAQQWADKHQQVVEEEAAVVKLLIEAKNQCVDQVIKMMNASAATQHRVLSSTMSI